MNLLNVAFSCLCCSCTVLQSLQTACGFAASRSKVEIDRLFSCVGNAMRTLNSMPTYLVPQWIAKKKTMVGCCGSSSVAYPLAGTPVSTQGTPNCSRRWPMTRGRSICKQIVAIGQNHSSRGCPLACYTALSKVETFPQGQGCIL